MMNNMTLTLASWDEWIWIVVIGATVVGSMVGNLKKKSNDQRKLDEGPNAAELEQMAARRREQLRQASQSRAQVSAEGQAGRASGEPGNLTMAERIARARAKAQYEQRAQGDGHPSQPQQSQVPNAAQRLALEQRQAELERQQQAARAQQQAQQQARQQAQQSAKQQAQQQTRRQQAQAHARAQAQARQRGTLIHENVAVAEPTESTTRRIVKDRPVKGRTLQSTQPVQTGALGPINSGSMSLGELRRAIVLNEVLGKPIAMRESEGL